MPFWDDVGATDSGWASNAVANAAPVRAAKPTTQEMRDAWNANRNDPAKIYQLMQDNNVGVQDVADMLGVSQQDVAGYLNSGRSAGIINSGHGDDLSFDQKYKYDEVHPEAQTGADFYKTVEPWMLDANGKFKGANDGVNYRWEGMTPDQVFQSAQPQARTSAMDRDGADHERGLEQYMPGQSQYSPINLKWEPGPDNGGGVIAGIGRAIGNMGTGIAHNPALMAALTAGLASAAAPATVAGDAAAATEMGGNATNASLYGQAGYGAEPTLLQSSMASPYAKPLISAGKTIAGGGNLTDAARSVAGSYVGDQVGGLLNDNLGSDVIGKIGGSVASSIVKGGDPLQALLSSGANAATSAITGNIDGFSELSPTQQSLISNVVSKALQGKSPTKALIDNVTRIAMGEVSNASPIKHIKTGGWAA